MEIVGIDSEQQLKNAILDTAVELVDLNGDGIPEVIAQGTYKEGCSPTATALSGSFRNLVANTGY
jgi:hypothetical protein